MPSDYKILADQNLIQANFEGEITLVDLIAHIARVNSDPDFHKGMNTIANFSETAVGWDYWELDKFRDYLKRMEPVRGSCKWALICRGGISVSTARLLIVMYEVWNPVI